MLELKSMSLQLCPCLFLILPHALFDVSCVIYAANADFDVKFVAFCSDN